LNEPVRLVRLLQPLLKIRT